ncbi:MAG: sugar phosphate isomerase/epimerase [Kiritimatiellae bacterium]|nr:sugar phosphate isomerase/epimerase [Kiritimatiellia bacterium]
MEFGICGRVEDAAQFADAGFDYFECGVADALAPMLGDDEWKAKREAILAAALPMRACNGFIPGDFRLTGPSANHAPALDYAERACRRADEVGCRYIVLGSGGARNVFGDFAPGGSHADVEQGLVQFTDFCKALSGRIADCAVTVVIEPLRPNESNLVNYVWQAMQLVADVDSPRVEALADIYHMMRGREGADSIVAAGQHLKHCHVAMRSSRAWPGYEPAFELVPYFDALKKIGYAGGVSCECGWPLRDGQELADARREAAATLRELAGR